MSETIMKLIRIRYSDLQLKFDLLQSKFDIQDQNIKEKEFNFKSSLDLSNGFKIHFGHLKGIPRERLVRCAHQAVPEHHMIMVTSC